MQMYNCWPNLLTNNLKRKFKMYKTLSLDEKSGSFKWSAANHLIMHSAIYLCSQDREIANEFELLDELDYC